MCLKISARFSSENLKQLELMFVIFGTQYDLDITSL